MALKYGGIVERIVEQEKEKQQQEEQSSQGSSIVAQIAEQEKKRKEQEIALWRGMDIARATGLPQRQGRNGSIMPLPKQLSDDQLLQQANDTKAFYYGMNRAGVRLGDQAMLDRSIQGYQEANDRLLGEIRPLDPEPAPVGKTKGAAGVGAALIDYAGILKNTARDIAAGKQQKTAGADSLPGAVAGVGKAAANAADRAKRIAHETVEAARADKNRKTYPASSKLEELAEANGKRQEQIYRNYQLAVAAENEAEANRWWNEYEKESGAIRAAAEEAKAGFDGKLQTGMHMLPKDWKAKTNQEKADYWQQRYNEGVDAYKVGQMTRDQALMDRAEAYTNWAYSKWESANASVVGEKDGPSAEYALRYTRQELETKKAEAEAAVAARKKDMEDADKVYENYVLGAYNPQNPTEDPEAAYYQAKQSYENAQAEVEIWKKAIELDKGDEFAKLEEWVPSTAVKTNRTTEGASVRGQILKGQAAFRRHEEEAVRKTYGSENPGNQNLSFDPSSDYYKSEYEKAATGYAWDTDNAALFNFGLLKENGYSDALKQNEMGWGMTDEQKETFYFLYAEDPEKAEEFAKACKKKNEDAYYAEKSKPEKNWLKRIGKDVLAANMKLLGGAVPFTKAGQKLTKEANAMVSSVATGREEYGAFNSGYLTGKLPESIPIIGGKGLGDLTQLNSSMIMSGETQAAAKVAMATGHPGAAAVIEVVGLYLQSGAAANEDYIEMRELGWDDGSAIFHAVCAGISEAAFEKLSLDHFVKAGPPKNWKDTVKMLFTQAGVEASEETFTTIANRIADTAIAKWSGDGYDDDRTRRAKEYMAAGMSYQQAYEKADKDMRADLFNDALGGFLSGLLMSGGETALSSGHQGFQRIQSRRAGLQMGNVLSTENLQQYISEYAQKENQLRDAGQTFDAKDVKAYRQGLETSLINRGVDWNGNREEVGTDSSAAASPSAGTTGVNGDQSVTNAQLNIDNADDSMYNQEKGGAQNGLYEKAGRGVRAGQDGADADLGVESGRVLGREDLQSSGVVLLSEAAQSELQNRGIVNVEYHDTSADNASFVSALDAARAADPNNGWAVSPQTAEGLQEEGARTFLAADGSSGFAIERSGNIVGVFRNKSAGGQKGVTKIILPLAIENGGTKLDCYGEELVRIYSKFGFYPVARVEFNEQYANPGWDESKGRPEVIFMAHNGDDAATVIRNWDTYHKWTREEIQALPLYDKNGYEDAAAYRDSILERQGRIAPAPPQNNGAGEVATGSAALRNDNEGGLNNVGIQGRSEIGGGGGQIDRTAGIGPAVGTTADGSVNTGTGQGAVSLSAGHRGGYGRNQAWGVSQETRREGRGKEQQSVIQQRQQAAAENPLVSSAEQGVPMGTEDQTVRIWSEEDWDAEAKAGAEYAYQNGVKKVTMMVGLLQVEADGEHCSVNGCINKDTGELFVRADSPRESISEIIEHEVGHLKTNAAKVRAFMEAVKGKYKEAAWSKLYETYEQRYADVTDNYAGMTEAEKELYIWEEIQCDAAAFTNKFGARASAYNAEATQTLESGLTSEETVGTGYRFEGGRYSNRETSAATDRTNGPGEAAEPRAISGKVNEDSVDWNGSREETETAREDRAGIDRRNGPGARFSIQDVQGQNGDYPDCVVLDTNLFNGVPTRNWGSVLQDWIYHNYADRELTIYDEDWYSETVRVARLNDRVTKDGAKNSHRVIDDLARNQGNNIKNLAIAHLPELLVASTYDKATSENSHQWMDQNGWTLRKVHLCDIKGNIFEATLNIAEARDGRRIIYDISLVRQIDRRTAGGYVPSTVSGRGQHTSRSSSNRIVPNPNTPVKHFSSEQQKTRIDADYERAVAIGDIRTAQRMVNEAAQKAGYTSDQNYRYEHKAPNAETGVRLTDADQAFGGDGSLYSPMGVRYYGDGVSYDRKAIRAFQNAEKNPEASITVYRAVPSNVRNTQLQNGDWVSTTREYAEEHGAREYDDGYRIIEAQVPAKFLYTDGNSIHELGYDNGDNSEVYKNTENNVKLAAVTYDDAGNVIPLSRRFDEKKSDKRFSVAEDEDTDFSASVEMAEGERGDPSSALRAPSPEGEGNAVDWYGNREEYRPAGERAKERLDQGLRNAVNKVRGRDAAGDYSAADYMADLKETEGTRVIRKNKLTDEKISTYEKMYKDRIITDKAFWNNLVSGYGEQQLMDAGFQYQEKQRKAKTAKSKDGQNSEVLGPPRPEPMTSALNSLGVKVQGSVADYSMVKQMLANDKSAKSVQREVRKAENRMGRGVDKKIFAKEKNFAAGIAAGLYSSADVPSTLDAERVLELADYYAAERATRNEMIRQRRAQVRQDLDQQMTELFKDSADGKTSSMIVLNERTPERNMRHIFGQELGERINETLFYPTQANEAERLRFINRMHDEVRTFADKNGKNTKLDKAERAIVQALLEGKSVEELLAAAEESKQFRQVAEIGKAIRQGKVDEVKMQNAVEVYKGLYNQLYEAINDFLVAHGYEPIGFIQNYAPHMQTEETQNLLVKAFQHLGVNAGVTELPASIAGLTADFKPSKRWNPHFLQREGDLTKYDVEEGFEEYIEYISDIFYHMDDTMRVRQAAKYFRETYAPEEIKAEIERVKGLLDASPEEKLELLRDAKEVGKDTVLSESDLEAAFDSYLEKLYERVDKTTKHSNLTMWLDNYANLLAGKQSMADRGQEYSFGRRAANLANRLVRIFAQSKVAGNLSSVFNQGAQMPMIYAELGTRWTVAAIKDIATGNLRRAGWWQQSDFLTGKHGVDYLVTTPGQMAMTALFKPAELMDSFVSTVAVRGKYLEQIKAGKSHEEAMRAADRFGTEIMGSRAKGSRPTAYSGKGIISQMVHIFQVEAVNSWEHLTQDLPRDFQEIARTKGKGKAALALAGVIVKSLIGAFAINRLDDELYGGSPAPFDLLGISANFIASGEGLTTNEWIRTVIDNGLEKITGQRLFDTDPDEIGDEDFDWSSAFEDAAYNISNDIPFVRNVAGVMGWGDQTMPMPDLYNKGKKIVDASTGHGVFSKDTGKAVLQAGTELIPGGNQINKAWQGVEAVLRGGDFSGYGSNEKLKYPLDESAISALRAIFFGKYATKESDAYYASGDNMLSVKQTQLWQSLTGSGIKRQDAYMAIQDFRDINSDDELTSFEKGQQKRDLIAGLAWDDAQKAKFYSSMVSDSRDDEIQALADVGLRFNDFLDIQSAYSRIDDEHDRATDKATAFSRWVNQQNYTPEQKAVINENFKYWMQFPAQAGKYEDFVDAGLSDDDASDLHNAITSLQPEPGKDQVSNLQKYRAVVDAGLNEQNTMLALEKVMTEGEYLKLSVGNEYGLSPLSYVDFKETMPEFDTDKNGSYTQEEVKSALSSMKELTDKQRAILWQITNKSWKPDNNPFNTDIGRKVYDDLNG